MRHIFFGFALLTCIFSSTGQEDAWVYLTDKPDSTYYFNHPLEMLSQRALDRRNRYGLTLDIRDVPVDAQYYAAVAQTQGIQVKGRSKWLNALHVQGDSVDIASLKQFGFVDSIVFADKHVLHRPGNIRKKNKHAKKWGHLSPDYGNDTVPYVMHNAYGLHQAGYTGQGVLVAIIDAGFPQADTSSVLQHVYARNGVVDTYNFPDDTAFVYTRHWHGTVVWAVTGGYAEGALIGTAYDADFCLYISEDVYMEMPVEETYWVMAAERADSVGVDVINTSLGYIDFDIPAYDHTWDELDGKTAFASRGAQIATEKGIHVIISAGNSGADWWQKISVPADAEDVIAVGAANWDKIRAFFSSKGNTADGRIKPDVMSWGVQVKSYYSGQYVGVSGTSLAAPVITGFVADLVQAYPNIKPGELKNYILQSSDRYQVPDSLYGYGFPDFGLLMQTLDSIKEVQLEEIVVYPNPFTSNIRISGMISPLSYVLLDTQGRKIREGNLKGGIRNLNVSAGTYFLIVYDRHTKRVFKLIKQP